MRNFYDLKAGDKVAVIFHHWNRSVDSIVEVTRVTKKQIITGTRRWRIEDGNEYGSRFGSWHIERYTPEHDREMFERRQRGVLLKALESRIRNFSGWTNEELLAVAKALGVEVSE